MAPTTLDASLEVSQISTLDLSTITLGTGGTLTVDGGGTINTSGSLTNDSNLTVANHGHMSVGGDLNNGGSLDDEGQLAVGGNFTNSRHSHPRRFADSHGQLERNLVRPDHREIANAPATGEFGRLDVTGMATLGGTFNLSSEYTLPSVTTSRSCALPAQAAASRRSRAGPIVRRDARNDRPRSGWQSPRNTTNVRESPGLSTGHRRRILLAPVCGQRHRSHHVYGDGSAELGHARSLVPGL